MKFIRLSAALLPVLLLFASCEKEEVPIELPPQGDATHAVIDLGSDYRDQVFYSMEQNAIVKTSEVVSWDLAFETAADGYHVFLNGGKEGVAYNTHEQDIDKVTEPPKIALDDWDIDAASGMPDSTAIGEWMSDKTSKGEVYILRFNPSMVPDTFRKIKLLSVDANSYTIAYGRLRDKSAKKVVIPKDANFNYAYFSLADEGSVVAPAPLKETWDFVFTRYRHIYYDLNNIRYTVTGVLLNPYNTSAYEERNIPFEEINESHINAAKFSENRDVIGFDWKTYSLTESKYTVDPKLVFIIKTSRNHIWKLHFLGYEGPTKQPGVPSYEFKRIK